MKLRRGRALCAAFWVALAVPASAVDPVNERAILLEFYQATGGSAWSDNSGWAEELEDICEWKGILCHDGTANLEQRKRNRMLSSSSASSTTTSSNAARSLSEGNEGGNGTTTGSKVKALVLHDNFLNGRAPDSLWDLPGLQYIDFSNNSGMDVSFGSLHSANKPDSIQTIKLANTAVSDLLGLANLKDDLIYLDVSGVPLNSQFPHDVLQLVHLQYLHMSDCGLQGDIPADIADLPFLRELNLGDNDLSDGFENLMALVALRLLDLSFNNFSGDISSDEIWDSWPIMEQLDLQHNKFTGMLPSVRLQPNLILLQLNNNDFYGEIPDDFIESVVNGQSDRVYIDLSSNRLTGAIPLALDQLGGRPIIWELAGNRFYDLDDSFCDNYNWNDGDIGKYGCDAILCSPGSFSSFGRATGDDPCDPCSEADFYGSTACLDKDDWSILKALYDATGGEVSWKDTSNWLTGDDYCEWYGISCWTGEDTDDGDRMGRVRKVVLPNNGLKGVVPSEVFHLQYMTDLVLRRNDVTLPFDLIDNSYHIETIDIASTETRDLGGLERANHNLGYFYADRIIRSSPVPTQFFQLQTLKVLSMSECGLYGPIPEEIGQIGRLQELYLYGNQLDGSIPSTIGNLQNLRILSLAKNALTGDLPTFLELMPSLQAISLTDQTERGGGLTGNLLSFDQSPRLTILQLSHNMFSGTVPLNLLAGADDLDVPLLVDFSHNQLTGVVPGNLARFGSMTIHLQGNQLADMDERLCLMDDWMNGLVELYGCDAILCPVNTEGGFQLFESAPCRPCGSNTEEESFNYLGQSKCATTAQAKISEREIVGEIYHRCGGVNWHNRDNWLAEDQHVCTWHGIECDNEQHVVSISLGANSVVGDLPTRMYQLPALQKLSFYSNDISFPFEGIEQATNLRILVLDSTGLVSLNGIGKATSLEELNVRYNHLDGHFPQDIARLENLKSLSISDNDLTGPIPYWLDSLTDLTTLVAGSNKMSGRVFDFAGLENLIYIDLSDNELTGEIPSTLLERAPTDEKIVVELSNNNLEGSIPSQLGRLSNLSIHLQNNQISSIPENLCTLNGWNDYDVQAYGCDGILCPIGMANSVGRQTTDINPCVECSDAQFMGSRACAGSATSASSTRYAVRHVELSFLAVLLALACAC